MPYRTEVHHRLPAHRPPPVPPAAQDMRAYRLGRSEMLARIATVLASHTCALAALRRQIEDELALIVTPPAAPTDTLGDRQLHSGQVAACRDCLDFLAARQASRAAFAVHIFSLIITTCPPGYREYLYRCKIGSVEDPTMPEPRNPLDLRPWYAAVDALHAEIDRTQGAGLPPSQEQKRLEVLLLRRPGEPAPCAE